MRDNDTQKPLGVVFVCRGNRFRSPLAAALFERAAPAGAAAVSSVGTLQIDGAEPLAGALENGARLGVDLSAHRSRGLAAGGLKEAELVLGFELSDIAGAVVDGRAPRERTFTLPELVGLLDDFAVYGEAARPRLVLDRAHRARATAARGAAGLPEIRDPAGQPDTVQREIADRIDVLVRRAAAGLFGPAPHGGAI
jgi:protein-tyrosine-phosphatase